MMDMPEVSRTTNWVASLASGAQKVAVADPETPEQARARLITDVCGSLEVLGFGGEKVIASQGDALRTLVKNAGWGEKDSIGAAFELLEWFKMLQKHWQQSKNPEHSSIINRRRLPQIKRFGCQALSGQNRDASRKKPFEMSMLW